MQTAHFFVIKKVDNITNMSDNSASRAPVAQLDRASDYGSEGREFESSPARHFKIKDLAHFWLSPFLLFLRIVALLWHNRFRYHLGLHQTKGQNIISRHKSDQIFDIFYPHNTFTRNL